jgi:predicted nucleic acid-binding protein
LKATDNCVLIDTSVWIEFFRSKSAKGGEVERLLMEDSVWTCGIVLFELLQGIKSEREKSLIIGILSELSHVEMSEHLWKIAAELSLSLKKKGKNLPFSDILISSIAIDNQLSIFTFDRHFEEIPGVKLYKPTLYATLS